MARELSPAALRAADRLVGRAGVGRPDGERRAYLCHTLCELGAEPLDEQLGLFRDFLAANPREVVMLFVEPYVPVEEIERALEATGLLGQAAELRRDEPLPTLGELIRADTRLVVLAEEDGGARPWYLPGFSFVQDTPLGATRPGRAALPALPRRRRTARCSSSTTGSPRSRPRSVAQRAHRRRGARPAARALRAAPRPAAEPRGGRLPRAQRRGGGRAAAQRALTSSVRGRSREDARPGGRRNGAMLEAEAGRMDSAGGGGRTEGAG